MLKPLQAIQNRFGSSLSDELVRQKQEKLLDALLNPIRDQDGTVVDVFAHGNEALRVVEYVTHVSLDAWNVALDSWVVNKTFSLIENVSQPSWVTEYRTALFPPKAVLTARQAAVEEALILSPLPNESDQRKKWSQLHSGREGVREQLFDSKAALAEFWYETKNIAWPGGEGAGHPYLFDFAVAEAIFRGDGVASAQLGAKFIEKIDTAVVNLKSDWRDYGTVNDLVVWIKRGNKGDDVPIVLEHFGVNYDLACDLIFSDQHERALRQLENVMVQEIKASVYYEKWSEESLSAGCLSDDDKGTSVDNDVFTVEELKQCATKFNISVASAQSAEQAEHIWFSSVTPDENRDFFENGISTYYALHIHSIDGREPNANDYQMIADVIGVKFAAPARDNEADASVRFG